MEIRLELGLGVSELELEQIAEEVVVAVPLALRVKGDDEQVRPLDLSKHRG
jgi:hypothetical protein